MRPMKITPLSKNKMVVAIALVAVLSMDIALSEIVRVGAARPLGGPPLPTTIERHLKASVNITGNDEERMFGSSLVSEVGKLIPRWFNEEVEILSKKRGPNIDAFVAKREKLNSNDNMVTFMRSEKHSDDADVAKFLYHYKDDERIGEYCSPMLDHLFEQWKEEGKTIRTVNYVLAPNHGYLKLIRQPTIAIWKLYAEKLVPVGDTWSLYNEMLKALKKIVPDSQLFPDLKRGSSKDDVIRCLYVALLKSELNGENNTPAMFSKTMRIEHFYDWEIQIWYDYVALYIYKATTEAARDKVVGETARDKVVGETARNKRADRVDLYQEQFRDYFKLTYPSITNVEVKRMPEMVRLYWQASGKDLLAHGKSYYDFMEKKLSSPKSST